MDDGTETHSWPQSPSALALCVYKLPDMFLGMCEADSRVCVCVCCVCEGVVGGLTQLSLTAVSWETSDETLHHLLCLCMCLYMGSWTKSHVTLFFSFFFFFLWMSQFRSGLAACLCLCVVKSGAGCLLGTCVYFSRKSLAANVKLSEVKLKSCASVTSRCYVRMKIGLVFYSKTSCKHLGWFRFQFL